MEGDNALLHLRGDGLHLGQRLDRRVPQARLDPSDVGSVYIRTFRKGFLRPTFHFTQLAHAPAR